MNRDRPLVSLNSRAEDVSYVSVLHTVKFGFLARGAYTLLGCTPRYTKASKAAGATADGFALPYNHPRAHHVHDPTEDRAELASAATKKAYRSRAWPQASLLGFRNQKTGRFPPFYKLPHLFDNSAHTNAQ
jgi:hypothetical protein